MTPTIHTDSRPSVRIGAMRSVVIGGAEHRVTFAAGPAVQWTGPQRRVVVEATTRKVVLGGRQGIAGPPGPGAEIEEYVAAVALGGHRAVALDASGELIYAEAAAGIPAMGVTRDAVAAGGTVAVYRAGRVPGWSGLTPGATYYLAASGGLLTLTPPESGISQPLGVAASATDLLVDPDYPTFL